MIQDFDWHNRTLVTIPAQGAIAVLETADGTVEIRQQCDGLASEHDEIVVVAKENVPALIRKLQEICSE